MPHHVEAIEDDHGRIRHVRLHGQSIRLPRVHRDGLDRGALVERESREIRVQALGHAIIRGMQHRLFVEADDHRDELELLELRMLVDAEPGPATGSASAAPPTAL